MKGPGCPRVHLPPLSEHRGCSRPLKALSAFLLALEVPAALGSARLGAGTGGAGDGRGPLLSSLSSLQSQSLLLPPISSPQPSTSQGSCPPSQGSSGLLLSSDGLWEGG